MQTATGAFSSPVSVAVDSYGNIYFTDNVNNTVNEIVAGTHAISTVFSTGSNSYPQGIAIDNSGNLYITKALLFAPNPDSNAVIELNHVSYLFNSLPPATPTAVNNLWENTQQIDISKSVFTAFASSGSVSAANFSNASAATSSSDYLFYNASTGGLYYDADGNGSSPAVEIAVVGVNSHPSALSIGDFKLVA